MLYQQMLKKSQQLENQIKELQHQIKTFPEGKIFCSHNGKYTKWYQSDGKNQVYIPKNNRNLATQLAIKKYLTLLSEELLHEKQAIDFYLRHHSTSPGQSYHLLTDMPEYKDLLSSFFQPLSEELSDWMNSPYESNSKYPHQLIHKTASGTLVRSKSETMIATILHTNRIPFRYECALVIGETTIFPDFTIRHPKTGEIFYWEHFGLMDEPNYYKNTYSKLQLYTSIGIIPTISLITTYETKENPLNFEVIEKTVTDYFL